MIIYVIIDLIINLIMVRKRGLNQMRSQSDQYLIIKNLQEFLFLVKEKRLPSNKIIRLDLSCKNIGPADAKKIADVIINSKANQDLELILCRNNIGDEGANNLALALESKHAHKIVQLDLRGNHISVVGFERLAKAITSDNAKENLQLNLSESNMGSAGVKYFADAIKSKKAAKGLNLILRYNNIDNDGAQYLLDAIKSGYGPNNLKIDLLVNNIEADLSQQISSALIKNDIMHAALACIQFQKGQNKPESFISLLPIEILLPIYSFVFNDQNAVTQNGQPLKNLFAEKVASYFKPATYPTMFSSPVVINETSPTVEARDAMELTK